MNEKTSPPRHLSVRALELAAVLSILNLIVGCGTLEVGVLEELATPATRQASEIGLAPPDPATGAVQSSVTVLSTASQATAARTTEAATAARSTADGTETSAAGPPVAATDTPTTTPVASRDNAPSATPTVTPRATTPVPTATPARAQLLSVDVSPDWVDPGGFVTLSWSAQGEAVTICPSARYVLFTDEDCRDVPLSGSTTFIIPDEAAGFGTIDFLVTVEGFSTSTSDTRQVSVALRCQLTWFFSTEPQAGVCPREPVYTHAAAQHFESGYMIWLKQPGRTFVLEYALMFEGEERRHAYSIDDPLDVIADTSADIQPPAGFYAPEMGFGLVWRGDVRNSPGFRDRLGWALEPEFGYDAIYQCDDALPSGGRSWQSCNLLGPGDEIIFFHPLGGWLTR